MGKKTKGVIMKFLFIRGLKPQAGIIALLNYLNKIDITTYQYPKLYSYKSVSDESDIFYSPYIHKNEVDNENELAKIIDEVDYVVCDKRYFDVFKDWRAKTPFHYLQYKFWYGYRWSRRRKKISSNILFYKKDIFKNKPIIFIDSGDSETLDAHDIVLLDNSFLCFKRELRSNRFASLGTLWSLRNYNISSIPELVEKFRPLRLGISDNLFYELSKVKKESFMYDIFWIGSPNSYTRLKAEKILTSISKKYNLKINDFSKKLPKSEFYRCLANSKITISLEGGGWDCYRHYEAVALRTPLLLTTPSIELGNFFDEEMVNFMRSDLEDMESKIVHILENYAKYEQYAKNAYEFLQENLTTSKIGKKMFEEIITVDKNSINNKLSTDYKIRYR